MDQKSFLILNGIAVVVLVAFFWRARKRESPSQLKLGKTQAHLTQNEFQGAKQAQGAKSSGSRVLNVVFNYNAESWNAFEVLGLPAGSSVKDAENAFLKLGGDTKNEAFYREALEAIRKAYSE